MKIQAITNEDNRQKSTPRPITKSWPKIDQDQDQDEIKDQDQEKNQNITKVRLRLWSGPGPNQDHDKGQDKSMTKRRDDKILIVVWYIL